MIELKKVPLRTHSDGRGTLTEIFREEWPSFGAAVQWNCVRSEANVLRGVHVHVTHVDYLVVLQGRVLVGVSDLREDAAEPRSGEVVEMSADPACALLIPNGVAHGFYSPEPATYVYGTSHYWDPVNDEFACRWDDPGLSVPWPAHCTAPRLSERDQAAGSLEELRIRLRAAGFAAR